MSCELGFRGFLSWLSTMAAILTALHSSDVIGTGLAVFAAVIGVVIIFVLTCAEPEWSQELDGDFDLAVRKSARAIEEWPRHVEAHRLEGARIPRYSRGRLCRKE